MRNTYHDHTIDKNAYACYNALMNTTRQTPNSAHSEPIEQKISLRDRLSVLAALKDPEDLGASYEDVSLTKKEKVVIGLVGLGLTAAAVLGIHKSLDNDPTFRDRNVTPSGQQVDVDGQETGQTGN